MKYILSFMFLTCTISCGKAVAENYKLKEIYVNGTKCITNGYGVSCNFN